MPLLALGTAAALKLDRRTFDAAERTEDAAISTVRAQELAALPAFVEEHTRISRHDLKRCGATFGTGQDGLQRNFH